MTGSELKKLNRAELLELLLDQVKQTEKLQQELEETKALLEKRELDIRETGSVAEAALKINKVFEAADAAAVQYLDNAIARADEIVRAATAQAEAKLKEAESLRNEAGKKAEQSSRDYEWLRELLDAPSAEEAQRENSSEEN